MTGRADYDEFGLLHESAAEYGLPFDRPPAVRRSFADVARGRRLSAGVTRPGRGTGPAARRIPERPYLGRRGHRDRSPAAAAPRAVTTTGAR